MTVQTTRQNIATQGLQNYNDLGALQAMKHKSAGDDASRLNAVAKQFESMFVSMMIKSMRDANKAFSEGNMLSSQQGEFYQQMYDSQLAVTLASGKGIGLAGVIEKQLSKSSATMRPEDLDFSIKREGYSVEDYLARPFPARYEPQAMHDAIETVNAQVMRLQSQDNAVKGETRVDFSSPESFIASLYPMAKQAEEKFGIDARVMIAQSALETGWGQHQITHVDGSSSHNLFGIKAHGGWQGAQAIVTTTEYRDGVPMKERAAFRAYDSFEESFNDYAQFLQSQPRYRQAVAQQSDPAAFAQALQSAGYATDPQYARKIESILDRYLPTNESGFTASESEVN